jgi:arylsulfatase A
MLKNLFSRQEKTVPPPNILVIMADDLGYGDLGCYGASGFETPNLDQIAAEGVRFTSYYSGGVNCTGGRASFLTGCYPNRVGLGGKNIPPGAFTGLNPEENIIPKVLEQAGYVSGYVGKWTLGSHEQFLPTNQGFDYFFGIPYSHSYLDQDVENAIYVTSALPLIDGVTELEENTDPSDLTTKFTEQAAEFVESAGDNPFFLFLSHSIPHRPLMPMENFEGSSKLGIYGDAIQELDWSIGALMEVLRQFEKLDNTLIIFTSDNGPALQSEETLGYVGGTSRPFRGGKGQTLEGGLRVPCVARLPERIPAGLLHKDIVTAMDWLPTFADIAGVPFDKKAMELIDGVDIWPLISGAKDAPAPRQDFCYYREGRFQAYRRGEWKLLMYRPDWEIEKPENTDYMLFNLESDPQEKSNLADQHPDLIEELSKAADKARRELGDVIHNRRGRAVRKAGEVAMT